MADGIASGVDAAQEPLQCPKCKGASVSFDYLSGLAVCESCGRVLENEDLVASIFIEGDQRPQGVFISQKDSGLGASASNLYGTGVGRTIQRSRSKEPMHKLRQHLKLVADGLALSNEITEEAEEYLERLRPDMPGTWRREDLAAAAAYIAVRQNNLPLTLLDLAKATHIDVYTLGKFYRQATETLGIPPPQVQAQSLLTRAISKLELESKALAAQVELDAAAMMDWINRHLIGGSRHPLVAVGVAVVIALEMNNVAVGHQYVAGFLNIGSDAVAHRMHQVKEKLLSFKHLLPYGATINGKNVFCHARAIMRMSNVLEQQRAATEATMEGNKAASGSAAAPALAAGELGPASKVLTESQKPALEAAKLEARLPKDYSKRRKLVRFEKEEKGGGKKEPKQFSGAAKGVKISPVSEENEDEDGLGSELDASDSELDMYLRTAEEVEAFKEAYEAVEEANAARGGV